MDKMDKLTISMTDARPVRVTARLWPVVAQAAHDRDANNQALLRRYHLCVRLHAQEAVDGQEPIDYYGGSQEGAPALAPHPDGRVVAYGSYVSSYQSDPDRAAGFICTLDTAPAMIERVGEIIGAPPHLVEQCIGDLPPVDLEGQPS
jgi:hypothetical protein